jgi:hypothetical protein
VGIPVLAVALLGTGAGCARGKTHQAAGSDAGATSASAAGTVVRTFRAYDAAGHLVVAVRDARSGNCWTTSIAAQVPGAYRCLSGNDILDPCFAAPTPAHPMPARSMPARSTPARSTPARPVSVACLEDPWSDAVVLHLTAALPAAERPVDAGRPWALELSNGARCVAATGTVPEVRGVDLAYRCGHGRSAALLGAATPSARAEYGDPATETLQPVTVTTIWRA